MAGNSHDGIPFLGNISYQFTHTERQEAPCLLKSDSRIELQFARGVAGGRYLTEICGIDVRARRGEVHRVRHVEHVDAYAELHLSVKAISRRKVMSSLRMPCAYKPERRGARQIAEGVRRGIDEGAFIEIRDRPGWRAFRCRNRR